MSDDLLRPGGALEGRLFRRFLKHLSSIREPEPGERIGAWKIMRELGRGGSGVVFLAERADGAYSQEVALKWLRSDRPVPGGRDVLRRERELLAALDHPNIARLVDGGETDDGMLWFALDYVDGDTIDRAAARLDLATRLKLIGTLCQAAHHAHRRGLIHGDIKPSNVLVDPRGHPRLLDFGISRLKGGGPGGSYGLTPDYASPEQRRHEPLTTASDIWQLGRMLEDLIGNDRIPRDLRAIVAWATADSPEDRYHSAAAMGADIDAWLERRPVEALGGGALYRVSRLVQRNRLVSSVTVVALVIIVGGGAWMTWQLAAERDHARAEAARAEAALADARAELARAESLREFLISLFRAARQDRPRDDLPSTEELLADGARRAMDEDSAPAADRFGMLATISEVYVSLGQPELAEPLINEALELARASADNRPEDLARALIQKGVVILHLGSNGAEEAARFFADAEKAAAGHERARNTWVHARTRRAWLLYQQGRTARAMELLEPVARKAEQDAQFALSDDSRLRLTKTLSAVQNRLGHRERALAYSREAVELSSSVYGAESLNHAVERVNLAAQQIGLGDFDRARNNLEIALDLYQRIYEERPVNYRAAALSNLATVNLYSGRWESALELLRASLQEWAGFQEIEPAEYRWRDFHMGWMLMRMQRLDDARPYLQAAADRFSEPSSPASGAVMSRARLALVHCRLGDVAAGRAALAAMAAWSEPTDADYRAEISESRAVCLHAGERHEEALESIDASLAMDTPPGQAMIRAQRLGLRAEILEAIGRAEAAKRTRRDQRMVLREAGLDSLSVAR